MAVVVIHKPAVGVGKLELCPGNQIPGHAVLLLNYQRTGPLVPKREPLDLSTLNENILRGAIEDVAVHGLDLTGLNGGPGLNASQHNLAGLIAIGNPPLLLNK